MSLLPGQSTMSITRSGPSLSSLSSLSGAEHLLTDYEEQRRRGMTASGVTCMLGTAPLPFTLFTTAFTVPVTNFSVCRV